MINTTTNKLPRRIIFFIVILIVFLVLASLYYQRSYRDQYALNHVNSTTPSAVERIIAPAIIDSMKDVIHVVNVQPGIIKELKVSVGQLVAKNAELIAIDDTAAKQEFIIQQNTYQQALNALAIQKKQLAIAQQRLTRAKRIDPRAISKSDVQDRVDEVEMAKLQVAQADLNLSNAKSRLKNAETLWGQYTIKAPMDGIVLQLEAHPGEFAAGGQSLALLGSADKVYVRVSIDERDMPHFRKEANAEIVSIDGSNVKIPVTFAHLNQYIVVPEYLNTRCQEAIYYFKRSDYPSMVAGKQFEATINLASSSDVTNKG